MAGWHWTRFEDLPRTLGLYALYERDRLLYIGQSWNLRARVQYHRQTRSNGHCSCDYGEVCHHNRGIKTRFCGVNARRMGVKIRLPRRGERWHESEAKLIYRLKPPFNRVGVRKRLRLFKTKSIAA